MSALPPEADIRQRIEHVRFVPLADIATWLPVAPTAMVAGACACIAGALAEIR